MAEEDADEDSVESEGMRLMRKRLEYNAAHQPPRVPLPRRARSTHGGALWSYAGAGWWVNSRGGGWFGSGLPPGTVPEP
jgi:hypothetical protein